MRSSCALTRRGLSFTASVAVLALAQIATPAAAQTADPTPAPAEAQAAVPEQADQAAPQEGAIVVTGSRIRRQDFETPNPVVTLGAQTLQESGTTNLTDFLTGYPALQGSATSGNNSGDRAGIGYTGLNLLDLRNLGTQRTLVLVDGRRHVSGVPGTASVDINTIPNDLVERIEVLTGGASAIYGADGVSGVVNFIMKKNFQGISARAQAGISEYGDAGQRMFSITAGKNFADGRGNIAIAYEYGEEDRLDSHDRERYSGTNQVGFYRNPNGTTPTYVPLNDIRYFDTARQGGIDLDFDGLPDYFVGANGLTPYDPGKFVRTAFQQGGSGTLVSDYGNDLLPEVSRHVVNAIAHFDVSPAFSVFAEAKYARTHSYSLAQPTFDYYLLIPEDNPYIPAALRPLIAATGNGGVLMNRDNFDFGQRGEDITRETYRGVFGVRGDLSSHLNYEVSYTYGRTDVSSRYLNDILDDRFYAAIDVVQGANGPTCRVNVNPAWTPDQPYASRDVFSPTTFRPGECVPLNLFGEGAGSQAAYNWIKADTLDRARIQQHVATAYLSGDLGGLFTMPGGGQVGFSVGAEYRKEKSSFTADPLAAQGLTFANSLSNDGGQYDVKEVFGELNVPLLTDTIVHRLEVGGAVRFSDYSSIGHTTTWKLDGKFAPVRDITFNGTYSKAVRAPNIGELYAGNSQTFEFITDPCLPAEIQFGTQYRAANCQALLSGLGANPATYTDSRSTNLPGFAGGNPNLKQEEATTWTAGVVLQPSFIPGLSLRADWYDIKLKNAINQVTSQQLAELCVDQPTLSNPFCAGITRQNGAAGNASAGNIVSFNVVPQNVAQFRTAGLDVNFNYRLKTDNAGTFNLSVVGNYLDRLEFIGTPGADVTNSRGQTYSPKYTVNADLTWQLGGFTANYGILWFDKTSRYTNQQMAGDPTIVAEEYKYLKQRWQHDIYLSYDIDQRFQIYGGVRNLFGQMPELGTRIYPVNAVGRFGYVGAKVKLPNLF
ncbi:outer membrane receptor protein involved in Fe transport [Sphingomonas kyeonggiensis]|uniref:Outer membrane receptor protein involved in Fe transport n=1 Tax=Sphingomonas kyeonggiensis TaxID=1268553 RepID=A0A7W7K1M7_9SPHN|nr:TonB-dependent receptor [Sphingomonas kyeonggiensis]MBB4839351.1 outer membrane receptor protein involved in Fe transport [Sphingomonas kyeonggiensis]